MPINFSNVSKGQRVNLDESMKFALIGLGWDANQYAGGAEFDLDAAVFLLGADGKVLQESDFIFYGNLEARDGAVKSMGDDQSGGNGAGDNEQIFIDFSKIPDEIQKIAITVTIYDAQNRGQNFGQITNSYVRVLKLSSPSDLNGETAIHFDLGEEFSIETAIVVCEIYRYNGTWKFNALAQGYEGGLAALCSAYGVETY